MSYDETPDSPSEEHKLQKTTSHLTRDPPASSPTSGTGMTVQQLPTPHSSKQTSPSPSHSPTRMPAPPFTLVRSEDVQHIWVVSGPAGSGKSTIGKYLSAQCSIPYLEGDDFHPESNKAKMGNGIPLTDADRWDWLITLRNEAVKSLAAPSPTISARQSSSSTASHASSPSPSSSSPSSDRSPSLVRGVIVTCSALKSKYRDVFRIASYTHPTIQVHFIFLRATEALLQERVAARQGHYMKSDMVRSQLLNLEDPHGEEDVLFVDVEERAEVVCEQALAALRAKLREYEV